MAVLHHQELHDIAWKGCKLETRKKRHSYTYFDVFSWCVWVETIVSLAQVSLVFFEFMELFNIRGLNKIINLHRLFKDLNSMSKHAGRALRWQILWQQRKWSSIASTFKGNSVTNASVTKSSRARDQIIYAAHRYYNETSLILIFSAALVKARLRPSPW